MPYVMYRNRRGRRCRCRCRGRCCCRRRRNGRRRLGAFSRDRSIENPVAGYEEVRSVGGVDDLQRVDGHLIERHVHLLRFLHHDRSWRHPEKDGVL